MQAGTDKHNDKQETGETNKLTTARLQTDKRKKLCGTKPSRVNSSRFGPRRADSGLGSSRVKMCLVLDAASHTCEAFRTPHTARPLRGTQRNLSKLKTVMLTLA